MATYASVQDLEWGGLPQAALASIPLAKKSYHLRQVSARYADSVGLRARYTLPIYATVQSVEYIGATGTTATGTVTAALTSGAEITDAVGIQLEVLTTGAGGVATGRISTTSGNSWGASFVLSAGSLVLSCGVTLTLSSGTWFDGDIYYVFANFGAVTHAVVKIAAYELLTHRGFNSDDAGYDAIKTQYKDSVAFFEKMPSNRVDPGQTDATPGTVENSFIFIPDDFATGGGQRNWDSTMGRSGRSSASVTTEDSW